VLASPLIYSGQLSREDYELRFAHSSGTSELIYTERCSSSSPLSRLQQISQEIETQLKTGRRKEVPKKFALSGSACVSADEGRWGWQGGKITVYCVSGTGLLCVHVSHRIGFLCTQVTSENRENISLEY
jgi:hypothetical protein